MASRSTTARCSSTTGRLSTGPASWTSPRADSAGRFAAAGVAVVAEQRRELGLGGRRELSAVQTVVREPVVRLKLDDGVLIRVVGGHVVAEVVQPALRERRVVTRVAGDDDVLREEKHTVRRLGTPLDV